MDETQLAILGVTAFVTAMLSAVVGMAGGITLLGVMLLFMDPLEAIPLHGAIQLASNGSRTWIQREHVRWDILVRYAAPLIPMGLIGLAIAQRLEPQGLKAVIGVFVLLATWSPRLLLLGQHPDRLDPQRRFLALGALAGVLNVTIGATGPLIAPFFLGLGLSRFALVGTKAACQTLGHLVKIALFGAVGFAFAAFVPLLALLIPLVVVGTWVGSRLLRGVDERTFVWLYRGVLTLIALRLVASAL
jgi:uncharacterized membrane protein YfcA